jgi:Pectate lyase superfamily protein
MPTRTGFTFGIAVLGALLSFSTPMVGASPMSVASSKARTTKSATTKRTKNPAKVKRRTAKVGGTVPARLALVSQTATSLSGFSISDVIAVEGQSATIDIRSKTPPNVDIAIDLIIGSGTARIDDRATGRDLTVPSSAILKAGSERLLLDVVVRNDEIRELDESRKITVVRKSDKAFIATLTITIVDDDRKLIVDVREMGATGNGSTDDTFAIQRAIDTVYEAGGGVVRFPIGIYLVTSVKVRAGITFLGEGGIVKRPPMQGKWVRTFNTDTDPYKGDEMSPPLVIQGMIFDGNRQAQSEYRNYELEQAHMVMLQADVTSHGQLRAYVDQTTFLDGVADGLSIYTNVNAVVTDSFARDVFRGGLVVGGGNTDVVVDGFTTKGPDLPTGIDFEIDGPGYGGSLTVRAKLSNLDIDADFDIGVGNSVGSTITVDRLTMHHGPFTSYTPNAKVLIKNSTLHFGGSDVFNRIVFPFDLTIANSRVVVSPDSSQPFAAVDVWFGHREFEEQPPGVLTFRDVTFIKGTGTGSPTFGVYRRVVRPVDQILFENVEFDPTLTRAVGP